MSTKLFENAEIIEVGPGSGYNTLAFFEWGAKHIDLVEANPQGLKDMQQLFTNRVIEKERFEVYPCYIEEFYSEKKYDIVIAESFLQFLKNQQEVIECLKNRVAIGGTIVITCSDEIYFFVEQMKRLLAWAFVRDIDQYEKKVKVLAEQFAPQLASLRGVSRSPEEWVQDQLLNDAGINGCSLSIENAIKYFGDEFDILGGSPNMFTDYSWYKDIYYDYKYDYLKQFKKKNINLMLANMNEEIEISEQQNMELAQITKKIKEFAVKYEKSYEYFWIEEILSQIESMQRICKDKSKQLIEVIDEIKLALSDLKIGKIDFNKYKSFFSAFGRTQQYISFVKKRY